MLLASNGLRPGPRALLLFLAVVCLMAFYHLCNVALVKVDTEG